jgi:hypothetical protein
MRTLRKTIKWMFLLVLLGTVTAGGYAFYVWNESDELLRQMLLSRFHEIAPDWNLSIARARFDFHGRVHVYNLSLKENDGKSPLLDVPEAILTVDRERLADPETPMQHVRWIRPHVHLARDAAGVWNWRKLPPLKLPKKVVPEFHADHLTLSLAFQDSEGAPSVATTIEDVRLQLIPSGARQFLVKAAARFLHSNGVSIEGDWQLDADAWNLTGQIKNLALDRDLLDFTAQLSPDVRVGMSRLHLWLDRLAAAGAAQNADGRPATGTAPAAAQPGDVIDRLGLSLTADAQFRISHWNKDAEREFKISLHLVQGEVATPPVPFPLKELRGDIEIENQQILVQKLSAQSGATRIKLERARVLDHGDSRPADLDLEITGLPLDERIPGLLTPPIRRVYNEVQPTGEADLKVHLEFNGHDHWEHGCDVVYRNGTVVHQKFPYRIEQVGGTITQRGNLVDVAMQGRAGIRRVTLSGRVENPGPAPASTIIVKTAGIPIDEQLRRACPDKYRRVIDHLQLQGELEGTVKFIRAAGPGQPVRVVTEARLANGAVNCRAFPIPISNVSGEFCSSGETCKFEKFSGRFGPADVAWSGQYGPNAQGHPQLKLDFEMIGATFDRQLLAALPDDFKEVWKEFNPEGSLSVEGKVFWLPGPAARPRVARLKATISDAKMTLRSFPFIVTDVSAKVDYDGRKANILSFRARHDEATLRVDGGFATFDSDGEWAVHLDPLFVDDLEATPRFRRALPQQMGKIVETLNPRGKQDIRGWLEFRGKRGTEYPMTAAWDTTTVYSGTTINAGVDLRDIHGKAYFRGTWDGERAVGDGSVDLRSVRIFDYQLTDIKGPASIDGNRLVLGTPPVKGRRGRDPAASAQSLSARFISGLLALDAVVDLGDPMRYQLDMTLTNGELNHFAKLYMPNNTKLAGLLNGSMELKGEGLDPKRMTGSGKLVISPAALYELPVIVKIFNVLSFVPPDKKAFDKAQFVFDIKGGTLLFERIDLIGDAIILVGKGTVGFDGAVRLRFASRLGRRQLPIPIVREFVDGVSKGWVGVNVTNTLRDPKTQVTTFQQIDDALRRLLGVFDARATQRR